MRRRHPALSTGIYAGLDLGDSQLFGYLRKAAGERITIVFNLSDRAQRAELPSVLAGATILISTIPDRTDGPLPHTGGELMIRANEGVLLACCP